MAALPAERLDQRLLSGALQHCVALHQAAPTASDAEALGSLLDLALPLLPTFDAFGLCIIVRTAARLQAPLTRQQLLPWCYAAEDRLDRCVGGWVGHPGGTPLAACYAADSMRASH